MGSGWQEGVIKQAVFDHKCPAESVRVVASSDDSESRTVDMKVCGKDRRYRDLGGRYTMWVDITDGVPAAAMPR